MRVRHAFTGYVYESAGDGFVTVTDPATGKQGLFDTEATWKSGELTYSDYHMCRAVGGPKAADIRGGAPPSDGGARSAGVSS